MDTTKLLEADHRQVEALFDAIEAARPEDRGSLVEELAASVTAHMLLEEQVLYPAMAPATGDEAVEEGTTEHELARTSLQQMLDLSPDAPGFGAAMEAAKAGISHHVEEEEGEIFPALRSDGSVLESITTRFMTTRLELGLPVDAAGLSAASTKDELVDEARRVGIDGAASMTKADLAEELAAAMGGGR